MFQRSTNLPAEYAHNASALMTDFMFEDCLHNWYRQLNKKKKKLH
jgi:hypothetical protein